MGFRSGVQEWDPGVGSRRGVQEKDRPSGWHGAKQWGHPEAGLGGVKGEKAS